MYCQLLGARTVLLKKVDSFYKFRHSKLDYSSRALVLFYYDWLSDSIDIARISLFLQQRQPSTGESVVKTFARPEDH